MSEVIIITRLGKYNRFYIVRSNNVGILNIGDIKIEGSLAGVASTFNEAVIIANKLSNNIGDK